MNQVRLPLIAWDVDDVMNDLLRRWFEDRWLPTHPECNLKYEHIVENPPHNQLGVPLGDYLQSLDEYRMEKYLALEPNPILLKWFETNGAAFRHIVVTAVPLLTASLSAKWVFQHFGQWIRGFFLAPSPRAEALFPGYPANKRDIFETWIQPDLFIDDSSSNVQQARDCHIESILLKMPWSASGDGWDVVFTKLGRLKEIKLNADETI